MFRLEMEDKPSPRREVQLQGPRPSWLKVSKDSHSIRKPPPGPSQPHPAAAVPPSRQPIIIYTVSPKVIHSTPADFMTLVQRLTGPSPRAVSDGQPSPAARLAVFEKAVAAPPTPLARLVEEEYNFDCIDLDSFQLDLPAISSLDRSVAGPGILSPMPTSLPQISPGFFSPGADPNMLSFLHDLSPMFHGNKNYVENTFLCSPSAFLSTPVITSPIPGFDLFFNNFP